MFRDSAAPLFCTLPTADRATILQDRERLERAWRLWDEEPGDWSWINLQAAQAIADAHTDGLRRDERRQAEAEVGAQ